MKKHFLITALGTALGILLSYYLVVSRQDNEVAFSAVIAILSASVGVLTCYAIYGLTLKLDKLLSWRAQTNNRLFIGIVLHFFVAIIICFSLFYLYEVLLFSKTDFFDVYKQTLIKLSILIFMIILVYSIVYFALFSYYSFATLQIETVKQERKQIDLQLKALKSQLSPHFLFNSLNTISSLVYSDVEKTEAFIRRLAKMYQYTLSSYHNKLISLREELDFVESYQYLLATRFENRFFAKIDLPEEILDTRIPPLTLQMLLENAVKHNTMDLKNPLLVTIDVEEDHICIKNNCTEAPNKVASFHIGLKNINERYLLLANKGITITSGSHFIVKIPIIR